MDSNVLTDPSLETPKQLLQSAAGILGCHAVGAAGSYSDPFGYELHALGDARFARTRVDATKQY